MLALTKNTLITSAFLCLLPICANALTIHDLAERQRLLNRGIASNQNNIAQETQNLNPATNASTGNEKPVISKPKIHVNKYNLIATYKSGEKNLALLDINKVLTTVDEGFLIDNIYSVKNVNSDYIILERKCSKKKCPTSMIKVGEGI